MALEMPDPIPGDLKLERDPDHDPKKADWAPLGQFAWRGRYGSIEGNVLDEIHSEFEQRLREWPPFTSGLLQCSVEEYRVLEHNLRGFVARVPAF